MTHFFHFVSLIGFLMVCGLTQGAPTVQGIDPPQRARDVDPKRRTVTVTFDQPMVTKDSFDSLKVKKSMEDGVGARPRVSGGKWLDDKTYELLVSLCPRQQYSFRLAGKDDKPFFQSVDGEAVPEVRCVFTTGDDTMEERMLRSYLKLGDAIEKLDKRGEEVDDLFKAYESMSKELEDVLDAYMDLKEKDDSGENSTKKAPDPFVFTYDPTNGTVSCSDVWRVKQ